MRLGCQPDAAAAVKGDVGDAVGDQPASRVLTCVGQPCSVLVDSEPVADEIHPALTDGTGAYPYPSHVVHGDRLDEIAT